MASLIFGCFLQSSFKAFSSFQVTLDVFSKYLKEQVMDIIDNDKKMKHAKLAEGVENAIQVLYLLESSYFTGITGIYP